MSHFGSKLVKPAINRVKMQLEFNSDSELSSFLGIASNTINMWKYRGTLDLSLLYKKLPGISFDWLLYGIGDPVAKTQSDEVLSAFPDNIIEKFYKKGPNSQNHNTLIKPSNNGIKLETDFENVDINGAAKLQPRKISTNNFDNMDSKIPYSYSSVEAGTPNDSFNIIKGYWKLSYLINSHTFGVMINDDYYSDLNIIDGDFIIINQVRVPKNKDNILVEKSGIKQLMEFKVEKGINYLTEISSNSSKISFEYDESFQIIGVLVAIIKNF